MSASFNTLDAMMGDRGVQCAACEKRIKTEKEFVIADAKYAIGVTVYYCIDCAVFVNRGWGKPTEISRALEEVRLLLSTMGPGDHDPSCTCGPCKASVALFRAMTLIGVR